MFPPFPEEKAKTYCLQLYAALERGLSPEDIHLDDEVEVLIKPESDLPYYRVADREMFGVLVCLDSQGKEVVLKAFSGKLSGHWLIPGWVPPLFDVPQFYTVMKKNDARIHKLTERIKNEHDLSEYLLLKRVRNSYTDESLKAISELYHFYCMDGAVRTFSDLHLRKRPPTGTGDCCAPKLVNFAFQNGLRPVSLAEFLYNGIRRESDRPVSFFPPCDERCRVILPVMLGLEIVYRDECLLVVNKPSGLLSVPGRGEENQDCVVNRLRKLFPRCIVQPSVHRLDQDTSGLLVLAFTAEAQRNLSIQFQKGTVQKRYIALLEGRLEDASGLAAVPGQREGRIELPFRLDPENRPHQVFDAVNGKTGVTLWKKIKEERIRKGGKLRIRTRVEFTPLTGRTHQLRLAAADVHGLGLPVAGDRLYGTQEAGERLMLHACYICFMHPLSGEKLEFRSNPDF